MLDSDSPTKDLVRVLRPKGKLAALEENGAAVMFPCPAEIQTIRSKIDSGRADRYTMGRRIYTAFQVKRLEEHKADGYSSFLTREDEARTQRGAKP